MKSPGLLFFLVWWFFWIVYVAPWDHLCRELVLSDVKTQYYGGYVLLATNLIWGDCGLAVGFRHTVGSGFVGMDGLQRMRSVTLMTVLGQADNKSSCSDEHKHISSTCDTTGMRAARHADIHCQLLTARQIHDTHQAFPIHNEVCMSTSPRNKQKQTRSRHGQVQYDRCSIKRFNEIIYKINWWNVVWNLLSIVSEAPMGGQSSSRQRTVCCISTFRFDSLTDASGLCLPLAQVSAQTCPPALLTSKPVSHRQLTYRG